MPTCRMHNELSFIWDTISNRVTSNNLTLSNSQQSSSQSQSPISSAIISISPTPSLINTAIQNNDDSKHLCMPLEQHVIPLKLTMKKGKRKWSGELSVENIDREVLTGLNDEIDGETHFCLSPVDILKKLSPHKNLLAKSQIMSLLVELMDNWSLLAYNI